MSSSLLIYNVTIKVEWAIHDEWLQWMKAVHMPEVVATGCFTHSQLLRLIESDDTDGPTYAAQFFAESKDDYEQYTRSYASDLRKKTQERWGKQLLSFRSLMQIVQ